MNSAVGPRDFELVQRYAVRGATLQLGSMDRLFPIPVTLAQLDAAGRVVTLRAQIDPQSLDHFLLGERLALDVELPSARGEARCFSLEDLEGDWQDVGDGLCEIRCQPGLTAPDGPRPGGIRVPFVCGMAAAARLDLYPGAEPVAGRVLDLSARGCRVQVPVRDATVFAPGQRLPAVSLTFPDGQQLTAAAEVCHLRPIGDLYDVAIGLRFVGLDPSLEQRLLFFTNAAEMELAWRLGIESRASRPAELFHPVDAGQGDRDEGEPALACPLPRDVFIEGVRGVCRKLFTIAICLRGERWFPVDLLESAARDLLVLLESDRARLLYALGCLQGEPRWMRHTIEVAAELGDVMVAEPHWQEDALEGVAGALLHTLGKPLLQGPTLPKLAGTLSDEQRCLLRNHVATLLAALRRVGWEPGAVTEDVLVNINERLDGSGYPAGKRGEVLSPLVRQAAVIKMANKLLHPQGGASALLPMAAWRWLHQRSEAFDGDAVRRMVQRHGPYPIGCLARFSNGFLAWVRAQDERGLPAQVQVARNLAYPDTTLNTLLRGTDLDQLGEPEGVVNPEDAGVLFPVGTGE